MTDFYECNYNEHHHYGILFKNKIYSYEFVYNIENGNYSDNKNPKNYIYFNKILEELRNFIFK